MKSKNFLWLSIPLFILLLIAFLIPISPNDYWWYLRLGGEIASTRAIPTIETFTQTQAGQPMVYHSLLSALILFWVYQLGNLPFTILLRGILLAFTYTLLWKIMRDRGVNPQLASLVIFGRGNKRNLLFALLATLLATLINPRGFGVRTYVVDSLTVISNQAYSREWMPPVNEGWQMNLFFGWLAFLGLRYGIWFLFILSIFTAELLADWLKSRPRRGIPAMDYAIGVVVLIIPLALLPGIRDTWWADSPPALSSEAPSMQRFG